MSRPVVSPDEIESFVLTDGDARITVLSIGCVVQSWEVGGVPVVLGYADPADYIVNPSSMGILIGRVANRIAQGQIVVDGQTYDLPLNNGPHHIHGGPGGLGWRLWQIERVCENTLRARVVSDHLDQGYPGNVHFEVILKLVGHTLSYDIVAIPDRETPINMAQHLYFNLMGQGDVRDHVVQIAADHYTPTDAQALPLGVIAPVEGSIYDFRAPRRIADTDPDGVGHDASLVLNRVGDALFAEVRAPNGMCLKMWGDRPCVQLYTSGSLAPYSRAGQGAAHERFGGFCLEAQDYPNAMAVPEFPSILHGPETPYRQKLSIEITP